MYVRGWMIYIALAALLVLSTIYARFGDFVLIVVSGFAITFLASTGLGFTDDFEIRRADVDE